VSTHLRVGELLPTDRPRVEAIVRATGVFSDEEVAVALELFDETFAAFGAAGSGLSAGLRTADCGDEPAGMPVLPVEASGAARIRSPQSAVGAEQPASSNAAYSFFGAFDANDRLLGFACYGPTPGTDRTHDLYWIAVDPAAQGAGAGTLLLSDVERRLRQSGARLVVVETSGRAQYHATRAFYERRAYAEVARVRDFYGPADDRVVFTKRLQPLGPSHRPPSSSTTPFTGAE